MKSHPAYHARDHRDGGSDEIVNQWHYFTPISPAATPSDYSSSDPLNIAFQSPVGNLSSGRTASAYRLFGNGVQLKLAITGMESSPGALIGTTPVGFRPEVTERWFASIGSGGIGAVDHNPDGTIVYVGPATGPITEGLLSLSDVTTANVTSTKHGFAPKSPADATKFLNGAATPVYAQVKDSDLSTSDVTTNNVSTSKHGFAPKAPNDATKYLDGTGAYSVPPGSSAVSSVFSRTGAVVAVTGDYYGAVAAALTGATAASRYVGATTSGHPVSGTFATGDFVITQDGHVFICTSGGTPGTWVDAGSGGGGGGISADLLPWHISLIPTIWTPDATVGTWAGIGFTDSAAAYPLFVPGSAANSGGAGALFNSSSAQNDAIAWDVVLAAGTWDANFWVRKSTNTAIITLNQDGSSVGTADTYAASVAAAKVSITGWTVSSTAKHRMQALAATKNGSSSGYLVELFAIEFRRTA